MHFLLGDLGITALISDDLFYRDIKGANLLVDASGVVKLADFGMAKHVSAVLPRCLTQILTDACKCD